MLPNVLDPRMIDPSKPLSCSEIRTNSLTALNNIRGNNLLVSNLTATNINSINLTATSITVTGANISQANISNSVFTGDIVNNFTVTTITQTNYIFTSADNSKVFHFDTTTAPSITATFLTNNITEGFNVGITNTGTGVIILSSNFSPVINAPNTFNSVRHSGMFIYRANNQLYGVGVFE